MGGVLIRGEKGTAKSTAARALAALLPPLEVVRRLPLRVRPARVPHRAASNAQQRDYPAAAHLSVAGVFVELPVGATEDRVLGTLDLERALQTAERHFEPGLLARANRGMLYVDEVNLLPDHLVDVLLDAAAMGVNTVEREGVSFSHPAAFVLVGTMNPEEGDLRPQLLDRFALAVDVDGHAEHRASARKSSAAASPSKPIPRRLRGAGPRPKRRSARAYQRRAQRAADALPCPDGMLDLIARICTEFEVDGLRADIVIYKAAATLAAYAGRAQRDARGCAPGGGAGAAAPSPPPAVRPTGAGPTEAERRRGRVWQPRRSVVTATGWSSAAR